MRLAVKYSIAYVLLLLMSAFFNSASHAHSALVSSDPAVGSSLAVFPENITLTFNEELLTLGGSRSNYLELIAPSGESIKVSESVATGERLFASVSVSDPEPGSYSILYRVVSRDGHVIEDEIQFSFEPSPVVDPSDGTSVEVIEEVQERGNRNSVLVLTILIGLTLLTSILIYRSSARSQ